MSASLFAPRARFRLILCLVCLLIPALLTPSHGEQPAASKLSPEQKQKLQERDRLEAQVNQLQRQGKLVEATATAQKMLAIERQVYGDMRVEVATSLSWLADMYLQREDYPAARTARKEVLAIHSRLYGEKDWRVTDARWALADVDRQAAMMPERRDRLAQAQQLNQQLVALYGQGKVREAISQALRALAIRKETLGEQHPQYAASLNNLARLYQDMGEYARAEPLFRQAMQIRKQVLGEQHPDYASSLNNLAVLYQDMGEFTRAEPLYRQALQINKEVLGEKHPNYACSLNNLALLYGNMGEYAKAEPLYRQAMQITKQVLGEQHPSYAQSLNNLAMLYKAMGDYARAEPLMRQARQIRKQVLGERHADYASSLNNLAMLYKTMGEYARAEPLFRQAMQIRKQVLGEQHPDYASSLDNLAGLYDNMGEYARAEPLYRQAMQIRKQVLGQQHPHYAASLNNLALLYVTLGDYARAEPLYRQAMQIRKQVLGQQHPHYASSLNNLAMLYQATGEYARAEPLLGQALEIKKQMLGEKHPDYASSLNNLALLYDNMGEYAKAEPLYRQAMQINKEVLGEQHPDYASSLNNLAMLYMAMGRYAKAEPLFRQAVDISRANLELAAAGQSQRQQLAMLAQLRCYLDNYVSMAPQTPHDTAQYRAVLAWKGAVGCRQRLQHLARTRPDLADDFAMLDQLGSRLASLALATPDPAQLAQRRTLIQQLTEQKDELEAKLARGSAAFSQQRQPLGPAQLQAALPADTILVDFLEYDHGSPAPAKTGGWQWQRHVVAFVVGRNTLQRVDLGRTSEIGAAVEPWRLALQRRFRTEGDARLGEAVRERLWKPLEPYLLGARLVLVSPDGILTRVPFAALPGSKKDRYLVEEVALAIVPVPQLLPQMLAGRSEESTAEPSLLLVGDVRYDSAAVADSRDAPRGGALMHWTPLDATRAEVAAIKDSFQRRYRKGSVTDLREDEATEAEVRKEAPAHRYLHFATHGFFAPPQLRSALAAVSHGTKEDVSNLFGRRDVAGFHPGLLSGLVLAGANQPVAPDKDDGILTAMEVEKLDLSGVELAVLSACETGLGEEAGGEGLLGLQRAFQIAGARSVVASQWQVDDKATRELMVRFYENLWKRKLSKLEALRQAQLWMLTEGPGRGMVDVRVPKERLPVEDGRLAPYYWAAFSLSGDWR